MKKKMYEKFINYSLGGNKIYKDVYGNKDMSCNNQLHISVHIHTQAAVKDDLNSIDVLVQNHMLSFRIKHKKHNNYQ